MWKFSTKNLHVCATILFITFLVMPHMWILWHMYITPQAVSFNLKQNFFIFEPIRIHLNLTFLLSQHKLEFFAQNFSTPSSSNILHFKSPSVWPDLAKFRHFGNILQVFGNFLTVYFLFGKMLSLLWRIRCTIGLIFIVAYGQILKNNPTIWLHWSPSVYSRSLSLSLSLSLSISLS